MARYHSDAAQLALPTEKLLAVGLSVGLSVGKICRLFRLATRKSAHPIS